MNNFFRIIFLKLLLTMFIIVILLSISSNSFSQNSEDSTSSKSFRSFRFKTNAITWVYLYPNIGVEYKFSKRFASSICASYITRGVSLPVALFNKVESESLYEKEPLKGFELNSGLKYYFSSRQFISTQLIFGNQKYNDYELHSDKRGSMIRNEYGFGFIYGIENKANKRFFNELNIGLGWKYSFIFKTTHNYYDWNKYTVETSNYSENAPVIFIGWSFGSRINPQTNEAKIKNPYKNSWYFELLGNGYLGSFNYEFVIYNIKYFNLTGRIGLSALPFPEIAIIPLFLVNSQYQFSNRCFIEIGVGPRFFSSTYNSNMEYDFTSQTCIRYVGKNGLLFRFGVTHPFLTKNSMFSIQPSIFPGFSIGKSF